MYVCCPGLSSCTGTCDLVVLIKNVCVLACINLAPFRSAKYNYPHRLTEPEYPEFYFQLLASEKSELLQHADILKTLYEIVRKDYSGKAKIKDHNHPKGKRICRAPFIISTCKMF